MQKIVQIITKESIVVNIPENTIWVIIKFFIFASKASKTASSNIQKNFSNVINNVGLKISVLSKKS